MPSRTRKIGVRKDVRLEFHLTKADYDRLWVPLADHIATEVATLGTPLPENYGRRQAIFHRLLVRAKAARLNREEMARAEAEATSSHATAVQATAEAARLRQLLALAERKIAVLEGPGPADAVLGGNARGLMEQMSGPGFGEFLEGLVWSAGRLDEELRQRLEAALAAAREARDVFAAEEAAEREPDPSVPVPASEVADEEKKRFRARVLALAKKAKPGILAEVISRGIAAPALGEAERKRLLALLAAERKGAPLRESEGSEPEFDEESLEEEEAEWHHFR